MELINVERFKEWLMRFLKYNSCIETRLDKYLDELIEQYAKTGNPVFELNATDCIYNVSKHYEYKITVNDEEMIIEF